MRRAALLLVTLLVAAQPGSARATAAKPGAITTAWGQARTLKTPNGKQLVISTKGGPGTATHHIVEESNGRLFLSPVRPIYTPFGQSDVIVGRGTLGHGILINGKRYAITEVDGGFVYRDGKGQDHKGAIRDGETFVFPEGVAKPVETFEGTEHVLQTTDRYNRPVFQKVSIDHGALSLVPLSPISTQYGQATLELKNKKLEQRIELDGHSFTLSTNKAGEPVFTDAAGKRSTNVARVGTAYLTGRGATTRLRYSGAPAQILETTDRYNRPAWQRVTEQDGTLVYEPLYTLSTPYGTTTLAKQGAELEQRLVFGEDSFRVLDHGNGTFVYVGADGKEQTGVLRKGKSLVTPQGITKTTRIDKKSVELLETTDRYGRPVYQTVSVKDGQLVYEPISATQTQYGLPTISVQDGRLEKRIELAGASYVVVERGDKTFFVDDKGTQHDSVIRTATGIRTPSGTTAKLSMVDGDHEILTGLDRYGRPTYQKVTVVDGQLAYEQVLPLSTPLGQTTLGVAGSKLEQTIVLDGQRFTVGETKSGSFEFTDAAGKAYEGAPRIGGALFTPYGKAERLLVDGIKQDVVKTRGVTYLATVVNGALAYETLDSIDTPHGVARAVYTEGRVDHQVTIGGKPYTVAKGRTGTLSYVDAEGKPYRDEFAAKLRSKTPAPVTVKRVYDKKLAPLPEGPIVSIMNTQHMSQATYDQLRDAMLDAMTQYSPKDHYFIGLGSDPHPIVAFLENVGGNGLATNFPASGKYPNGVPTATLDPYVRRLIPPEVLNGSKKLVLVDQTNSGAGREGTLAQISRVFEQYLKDVGSPAKVERLAFSPVAQPAGTGHVDTGTYPEVGKFLYAPYEHIVSQYDRHVLGSNTPAQLVERKEYVEFKSAMLERMKRDPKLDAFLAKLAKN